MSNVPDGTHGSAETRGKTSAVLMALAVMALGAFVSYDSMTGLAGPGYAQVGPGVFPVIIGVGLLLAGGGLLTQAIRRQWQVHWSDLTPRGGSVSNTAPLRGVLLVAAALTLNVVLFAPLGFIAASALLFACVSAALGRRRFVVDIIIGLALAASIYIVFAKLLGLQLPAGDLWESLPWMR